MSYADKLREKLKEEREVERKDAIKRGLLADPANPTTLDKAIVPVGTCMEMCPEFERVQRVCAYEIAEAEKVGLDTTYWLHR